MGTHQGIRRFVLVCGLGAALSLVGSSVAFAADYHAAQGGSGTACSSLNPCNLPTAINQANLAGFGRVLVAAGNYNPASTLDLTAAIDLGPEPGAATPTIHGDGSNNIVNSTNAGSVLHDVALTANGGNTGLRLLGGTAERLFVKTTGGAPACTPADGAILRDSVCWADSSTGNASGIWVVPPNIAPSTGNVANVTAVGGRNGIRLSADVSGEVMTLNVTNVIAHGGESDVATEPSNGGVTHLNLDHSNFATVGGPAGTITAPGTNGNQTAAPLFADLGGGDFHQLPGSPTIDAGVAGPSIGELDLDRRSRVQSSCVGGVPTPDIGAYEVSAPTASPVCSGFVIGKLKLIKKKGIGKLTVSVPGAGVLKATGKGVKPATASTSAAGDVVLKLKAKGKKLKALNGSGKVKLQVSLAWAPTSNTGSTQTDKVKLKKK
jgi:hypothetical protein